MALKPLVAQGVAEVGARWGPDRVRTTEDGHGGAFVTVVGVALGERFVLAAYDIGFHVTAMYDAADVYPHYVMPRLARKDGLPCEGDGLASATWNGGDCTQVSRRSNRRTQGLDTAQNKLEKVIAWLQER